MSPHLSKLLLLFNIFQRHAKLDSDLVAASMPFQDRCFNCHILVRLQPPFVSEIKIVNIWGSLSSNTATDAGNKHIAVCGSDQRLECLYELSFPLPLLVISNNTLHFLRQGHVYLRNLCYRVYRTCTPSLQCGNQRANDFLIISNTVVQEEVWCLTALASTLLIHFCCS